ncbi:uncharacterized protein B0P05DRAFT_532351, partial [Gilbertella persicaria]|uniref:uncharacterized protein n=1 Tax=Gilbertella persicaria TaxID=101096 RepID=UPI00221EA5B0
MPLIVFGDGLKNKSHAKFKGLRYGVIEKLYRQLRIREKHGELLLLDIDEYKTSKTCNSCLENKLEHITQGSGIEKRNINQVLVCKTAIFFGIETLCLLRICSQSLNLFGTAKDTLPCSPDKAPPRIWCLNF